MVQAGRIVDIHIPRDRETNRPKGYAFAEYETEESADYAVRLFSGVSLNNRMLKFAVCLCSFSLFFVFSSVFVIYCSNSLGHIWQPRNPQRMCILWIHSLDISKTDLSSWNLQIHGFVYLQKQKARWCRYKTKQPSGYIALPNTGFWYPDDMQIHIPSVSSCQTCP